MVGLPMMSESYREESGVALAAPDSDHVERALLEARNLIESTVTKHRRERTRQTGNRDTPHESPVDEMVGCLIDGAESNVSVVVSGNEEQRAALASAFGRLAGPGRPDVVIRLLYLPWVPVARRSQGSVDGAPAGGARTAGGSAQEIPFIGDRVDGSATHQLPACEGRVAASELPEALLIDGRVASLRTDVTEGTPGASLVEDPATVRALDLMFTGAWCRAVPLDQYPCRGGRLDADSARRILECLRTGHTDEVAAREMRVSLRTYRRYVAEIMRELGANSRFQAGVRAVELGLLPGRH